MTATGDAGDEPGVGRFYRHAWEVASPADPLVDRMRTYHEFGHAALNAGTAWGGLLQHLDVVHRLTDWSAPGVLRAAVAAARHTHETYATLVSISAMGPQAVDAERLLTEQAGYGRFLAMGHRVGPPAADAARWLGRATGGADGNDDADDDAHDDGLGDVRRAALTACMQSPAVLRLLDRGTEGFRLSDISSRDWPDRRLRTLIGAAPALWPTLTPPSTPDERFAVALDAASAALRAAGHPTLTTDEYQAVLPDLVAELNRFSAAIGSGPDPAGAELPGAETVRVRERLPARVERFAATPDADGGDLATTDVEPAHLFLVVRRMRALRAQYRLSPDPGLPDESPVCAVVTPLRRDGRVDRMRLTLLADPGELARLPLVGPVVACLSFDALDDDDWRERWLPALRTRTQVVGLLDVPPEDMIDAWLEAPAPLRVTTMTTTAGGQLERAVVLRVGEEVPVVLLARPAAVSAVVDYVERASGATVRVEDRILDAAGETAVRLALDHLVTEDALWSAGR